MNNMTAVLRKNATDAEHAFDDLYGTTKIAGKEVESRHKGPPPTKKCTTVLVIVIYFLILRRLKYEKIPATRFDQAKT